jgi:two-component system cell cycle sensor histidine kinase/response regulator CckA
LYAQRLPFLDLHAIEKILLVGDEGDVRALIVRVLRVCGYTVLEANNGEEGLSIRMNHPGPIDLMITDVVMPRLGGRQLAERLFNVHPEMSLPLWVHE